MYPARFSTSSHKKGPPEDQRPKSREETPKEGYEARNLAAMHFYNAATHKRQDFFLSCSGLLIWKKTKKAPQNAAPGSEIRG
jgi:hypothetical protein